MSVTTVGVPAGAAEAMATSGDTARPVARSRTTPRSLALVALIIGAGLAVMTLGRGLGPTEGGPDELIHSIDTTTLAVTLLAGVALWLRHRLEDDSLNAEMMVVLGVTAIVVVPADLLAADLSPTSAGSLAAASRVVVAVAGVSVLRSNRPATSSGYRLLAVPSLTLVAGVALALAIDAVLGSSDALLESVLGLSSAGFVLLAFVVGLVALRRRDLRLELVALTMLGLGLADSVAFGLDDSLLSTLAGKAIRLVVVGSWLVITILELLNLALAERESARRSAEDMDAATLKLMHQVRGHERVVHDLRNGLLAVQGGLRALGHGGEPDPMLQAVAAEVERLRTSLELEGRSALPSRFDIATVVEPMLDCYSATGASVTFIPEDGCIAYASPGIVAEIIQNLVANACRHGGGDITVWTYTVGQTAQVRVSDRGSGVPRHRTAEIFDRGASTSSGTGVGLTISRRLAESQGGSLTYSDRVGGGAIFILSLPSGTLIAPDSTDNRSATV